VRWKSSPGTTSSCEIVVRVSSRRGAAGANMPRPRRARLLAGRGGGNGGQVGTHEVEKQTSGLGEVK
jgi:hypothetical protein